VSLVPYRDQRRSRERQPLDRGQIVQAALALLDEVGLEGLTMRHVAGRLGVKAASLYRHVQDKQELLVLVADEISREIPVPEDGRPWQDRLVDMVQRYRRGLLIHRDGARLLASTAPVGPRRLRGIDAMLGLLLSAGLADREAARAAYHLNNFVTEFVADEVRFSMAAEAQGVTRERYFAEARRHFHAMPTGEYPALTRLADFLAEDDSDGLFQFGVDSWIRGLERLIDTGG
jgi:TetR/AcrR family tetracycline transcriptional repressor